MITRSSIAFEDFLGSSIAPQVMPPWYELKTLYFPGFWPKMAPQESKNGRFWAEMGEHKSAFFSKTPSLNCLKMHHNKVLGSILMWEKFGVTYS